METIHILWLNRAFTPAGSGVKKHTHPYYHFLQAVRGSIALTVENRAYEVPEGTAALIPVEAQHAYVNEGEETAECIEIKFMLQNPPLESKLLSGKNAILSEDPAVLMLSEKILQDYLDAGTGADEAAKAYLLAILNIMARKKRTEDPESGLLDVSGCSDLTRKTVAWLERHYRESFRLDDLATELSFNKSYLCTAFKKDMNLTIQDCLNIIRIRHAAAMLSYSELPIEQVARACGFGTASHFNHVFRHYIGTIPSAVRKAYPKDILFDENAYAANAFRKSSHPGRLMFNVLAGSEIPREMFSKIDD